MTTRPRASRVSVLNIPHAAQAVPSHPDATVEIEYDPEADAITPARLARARATVCFQDAGASALTREERRTLGRGQRAIRDTLFAPGAGKRAANVPSMADLAEEDGEEGAGEGDDLAEGGGDVDEGAAAGPGGDILGSDSEEGEDEGEILGSDSEEGEDDPAPPQDRAGASDLGTVKALFMTAKLRSRLDRENDGVLGVQGGKERFNSIFGADLLGADKFGMYQVQQSLRSGGLLPEGAAEEAAAEDAKDEGGAKAVDEKDEGGATAVDLEDISYVRKPNLARILEEYEAMENHPKYSLKQVVLSRRFYLYAYRFANAQYERCLIYPTLPQPRELDPWRAGRPGEAEGRVTEKQRSRPGGHRFVIATDHQFGILMDGFPMENPNWSQEIEISRRCVAQINAMRGEERPRFVMGCGDLVDTESSFSGAIASWKKVMVGWERNLVFEQQVNDYKRVWAGLDPDIALVNLCGNHDVGNRATRASIKRWTDAFGDEYLSFWTNGSFNLCVNNCLFSNPAGAPDLYDEQVAWMEEQLAYARENDATHIFVYAHYPWFLKHEEEADDFLTSCSAPPPGWGPPGSSFKDSYFTIPCEYRKVAMALFKKYDVTACFCGHFHQNVIAKTSWGMPMIVTGPLSMNLESDIGKELARGESNGIGMRVVDVGEKGEFTHKWTLLDGEVEIYKNALRRISRMSMRNADAERSLQKLVDDKEREQEEDDELDFDELMSFSAAEVNLSESQAIRATMDIDFDEEDVGEGD